MIHGEEETKTNGSYGPLWIFLKFSCLFEPFSFLLFHYLSICILITSMPLYSNATNLCMSASKLNYLLLIYVFSLFTSPCRPSAIPGPIPDELVVPTKNSIGIICSNVFSITFELMYVLSLNFISLPCLNRCDIVNENGLAPRTLCQGLTC